MVNGSQKKVTVRWTGVARTQSARTPTTLRSAAATAANTGQRFRVADGRVFKREMGFAILHVAGTTAVEHVVFAETKDLVLIGSHCLEGLNLRVDPQRKLLIDAGPIVTGAAA